ncbi:MAG: SHOCT domain-containing protein [Calditrichaeota bacterium]|nr:MAG: SHOCT domain-containing protein [Calditrichota bacterium]MBL1207219.1 SHOCT domain-containing protein [Calditrichota bacterium]NOG47052.1 SHOCT domain-containing protein [Calditrichota bacterium]
MHDLNWFGGGMMIFWWGFIIIGIIMGTKWIFSQSTDTHEDTSLEILKKRFARGEINKKEFLEKKNEID